jgi:hypothetical protein
MAAAHLTGETREICEKSGTSEKVYSLNLFSLNA